MFTVHTEIVNNTPVSVQKTVKGLLLAPDATRPDQLENSHTKTAAKEIHELLLMLISDKDVQTALLWRLENGGATVANIIVGLVGAFPRLHNELSSQVIRRALRILRKAAPTTTEQQPKPTAALTIVALAVDPDSQATYWIKGKDKAAVKVWPKVIAVTADNMLLAEFANGMVFNHRSVATAKGVPDRSVSDIDDAVTRFKQLVDDPPANLLKKLRRVRSHLDAGQNVRLLVDQQIREQAEWIAKAVQQLPPTVIPTLQADRGEDGVHRALHPTGKTYTVRTGIDVIDDDEIDFRTRESIVAPAPMLISEHWIRTPKGAWTKQIVRRKVVVPEDTTQQLKGGRFDQHDQLLTEQSEIEQMFHELVVNEGNDDAIDLTIADSTLDMETAAALSQVVDTAEETSRPRWWRRTIDARTFNGAPIRATTNGWVRDIMLDNNSGKYGAHVRICHKDGPDTVVAHMEQIKVSVGQFLKPNDLIGYGEAPLLLPARLAAEVAPTVKDCKIKRFGQDGRVKDGWVVPTAFQICGIKAAIKVIENGRPLSAQEQHAVNHGCIWEHPNCSAPAATPNTQQLRSQVTQPPHRQPASCVTTLPPIVHRPPAVSRLFEPGSPCWHDPLTDDDTTHLIVTLSAALPQTSEERLAKLVAELIR